MEINVSREDLAQALSAAGSTHHDYESRFLKGKPDEMWPGFYAAYVLGRVGDFTSATKLTELLEDAPSSDDWAKSAADHVLNNLEEVE